MGTGALIAAAGKTSEMTAFRPLLRLNGTTMIQKEIDTLRRAGVSPIVVITGYAAEELERHLAHRGVVCIRNEQYEQTQMLDSVKMGLFFLKDQCDRVVFLPADAPLFSLDSLVKVMKSQADFAIPVFGEKSGHPIMISQKAIPHILSYEGEQGLKGAMSASDLTRERVSVEDKGILLEVSNENAYREILRYEQESIHGNQLNLKVGLDLWKSEIFFRAETARFLLLIDREGSMLGACKCLGMSYSRGWKMIKEAEDNMGFAFLDKRAGGSTGGNSRLTERGRDFLQCYLNMQRSIELDAENLFRQYFAEYLLESEE